MSTRRSFLVAVIAAAALSTTNAWAAGYPERSIRIIVPFAAGSGTDLIARATATALSTRMRVAVAVQNMPADDGATGTAAVAKAKPDGYTLLFTSTPLTITPHLQKTPSYDPDKDLVAVARIAVIPLVLVTSGKSQFKSFDDLAAGLGKNPGKIRYATTGRGAPSRLEAELLLHHLQAQAQDQPYRNDADALAATASGKADFYVANLPRALAQLNSGSLRALAVSSGERLPAMPDVPTLAEGMRRTGYEASIWFGMLAPAGTPSQVITRLENEIEYELAVAAVRARIEKAGGRVAFLRSTPFGAQVRAEYRKWEQVAKARKPAP